MDQPDLDISAHNQALAGLRRINGLSGGTRAVWRVVSRLARQTASPLSVLDLASGGGDLIVRLGRKARRAGLALRLAGCDRSDTAIHNAQNYAHDHGIDAKFFLHDVLASALPEGFDVVMCSLFLHHLPSDDAVSLMRSMRAAAARCVLIDDLIRCRLGWLLARIGTRLVSRSPVVHIDGPRSVEGAFTISEMRELARRAGWRNTSIVRHWPCRFAAIESCND